jgi:hypothetical protein
VGKLSHRYRHFVDWVGLFPTYSLHNNNANTLVVSHIDEDVRSFNEQGSPLMIEENVEISNPNHH